MSRGRVVVICALLNLACEGKILAPAGGGAAATATCATKPPSVGVAPLRRLTRFEYDRTVHDLFGDETHLARAFPDEELALGFDNNSSQQSLSGLLIEGYERSATALAQQAVSDLPGLLGCTPTAATQDACVDAFLPRFGRKVWRRPLEADELERLQTFYAASKASYDFTTAVRMVVEAMLQSPNFLYRVELPSPTNQPARVSSYALATRLSYLVWSSTPDAALLDAAAAGQLDDDAGLEAQAQRLLADPRAHDAVGRFFEQWLELDKVTRVQKSTSLFPAFTSEVAALMKRETTLFTDELFFSSGTLQGLLTARYTFMNGPLAAFAGVPGPTSATFEKVMLDPTRRAGVLTHPSVLTAAANIDQTSPVQRGLFVRSQLLCQPPPPPPATVNPLIPPPNPNQTTRERFAAHESNPSCAGCHVLMDPIGLGFEHYDAVGAWRDTEGTQPIDATGEVVATQDADGRFDGALELGQRLAHSAHVRQCVTKQWFRYAYGRQETDADTCSLSLLNDRFDASGASFRALLLALTSSQAFLYRGDAP